MDRGIVDHNSSFANHDILSVMATASTTRTARIIDGKALAAQVQDEVKQRVAKLRSAGRRVRLDAILVGGDGAAAIYARNQASTCEELGIEYHLQELPAKARFEDIAGRVLLMNEDDRISAVMIHLPLPEGVDTQRIQSLIAIDKDVEGVNPANIGNVVYGRRSLVPCTALAVMEMIESTGIKLPGAVCVCVGASTIVGKPVAVLLMNAEATVISTNVHTRNLRELTRQADVLIAAAGKPGLVTREMVKPGAVVIDVGINRVRGVDGKTRTVGDVAFDEVAGVAGWVSPVPGGVGPMTVAMLLRNTVDAAER
jgi:methylenetetrahydrofolate dehydrogenase (NADP+)/methenyltetrahydrofolate cyclohydrolase